MANRLTGIRVRKIDLVGAAANRRKITLFKAADGDNTEVTAVEKDALLKALVELEEADRQEILKAWGIEEKEVEPLEIDADKVLEILSKALQKEDDETPEIPEPVQKAINVLGTRLEKAEAEAADAKTKLEAVEAANRNRDYVEKAAEFSDLPGVVPDDFGSILEKAEGALGEDYGKLAEVLKAGAEAVRTGNLLKEIGGDGVGTTGSAYQAMEAKAVELQKAKPDLTKEQAFTEIMKSDPALYDAYVQETDERKTGRA
jgi:hypothetical protein